MSTFFRQAGLAMVLAAAGPQVLQAQPAPRAELEQAARASFEQAIQASRSVAQSLPALQALIPAHMPQTPGTASGNAVSPAAAAVAVPPEARLEAAFSPEGGALALVLKAIASARAVIRLQAYSFTSPEVAAALVEAAKRGVSVAVLVDAHSNEQPASRAALRLLAAASIQVRKISAYAIHHDKTMVVDGLHVQTGSFNYSRAAARMNSENVLVAWNHPALAQQYLRHWISRWEQGEDVGPGY